MQYTYIIYKLVFPNNKIYVGQTNNFDRRTSQYKSNSYNTKSIEYDRLIHKAIRKYDWDNVGVEIICAVSEEFVDDAERYFIKKYNSLVENGYGYNIEDGGNRNKHLSEETKKLMVINHADFSGKNHPMYGKKHSKESIKKVKENHVGFRGKRHSEETKRKLRDINYKSINMYTTTGDLIQKFNSITEASEKLNISHSNICSVCKGNRKSAGGYTFKYLIVDA